MSRRAKSSSKRSGAGSAAQNTVSPSAMAALEKAFMHMLSSPQTVASGANGGAATVSSAATTREPARGVPDEYEDEYGWVKRMPPSERAALERAAMKTIFTAHGLPVPAEFQDNPTSTPKTTTASGPEVQRGLSEADIAFPSGNDVYDHSPTAPFVLDDPAVSKDFFNLDNHLSAISPADVEPSSVPKNPTEICDGPPSTIMSFGAENGSHVGVVCDPATRQFLRAHPLVLKTLYVEPHFSAIPVYIAPSGVHAGAGNGLFAARRIAVTERLFREPPLLIFTPRLSGHIAVQFDKSVVDKTMAPRVRAAYDALHNSWPGSNEAQRRIGIARTNSITLNFPTRSPEDPLGGCFQLLSRANHSCLPNVAFEWDYKTFQGSLIAVLPIEAGEEIFLSYTEMGARKSVRREFLQREYQFKCTCFRCGPN